MAKEILSIPEEHWGEVIQVILAGLVALGDTISKETRENLKKWCEDELQDLGGDV